MYYTEITFEVEPTDPGSEILVAQLAEIGFESFEETNTGIKAYIQGDRFEETLVKELDILNTGFFDISYSIREVKQENWNRVWESSYAPVVIQDTVYIRASFHPENPKIKYRILIDPKMSFGTAHHETTSQMIEQMLTENFRDAHVLDMGCGTAVLGILAELLGAESVVAIDNDKNTVENALENVKKNNCKAVNVQLGTAERITGRFDVILANINKNILIRDMGKYASHLNSKGAILFSGFYKNDLKELRMHAQQAGLAFDHMETRNNWVVARFIKL